KVAFGAFCGHQLRCRLPKAWFWQPTSGRAPGLDLAEAWQCAYLSSRFVVAGSHVLPVPHVPDGFEELRLLVLILQVIGVLPRIQREQRRAALDRVRLMIVDLRGEQAALIWLPHERAPT